ncbi:MAG: sialate O-acetylesterase [Planctomycetota bacterium]
MFAKKLLFLMVIGSQISCSVATPQEPALPDKQKFYLYVLMGQSNMAGDARSQGIPAVDRRVLALDKQLRWRVARDPLHPSRTHMGGVGPGIAFGTAMAAADPTVIVGLIPCAVRGSPLKRWQKGGDLYEATVNRTKAAMTQGTLAGFLWHQGESNARARNSALGYARKLAQIVKELRRDLQCPDIPFIAGKLGGFLDSRKFPFARFLNQELDRMPQITSRVAIVSSSGLTPEEDRVHFNAESARELGRWYATAMLRIQAHGLLEYRLSDRK